MFSVDKWMRSKRPVGHNFDFMFFVEHTSHLHCDPLDESAAYTLRSFKNSHLSLAFFSTLQRLLTTVQPGNFQ